MPRRPTGATHLTLPTFVRPDPGSFRHLDELGLLRRNLGKKRLDDRSGQQGATPISRAGLTSKITNPPNRYGRAISILEVAPLRSHPLSFVPREPALPPRSPIGSGLNDVAAERESIDNSAQTRGGECFCPRSETIVRAESPALGAAQRAMGIAVVADGAERGPWLALG
jgi:hypothetical protein